MVRERIRQIQIKVVQRLAEYVRQKKSLTAHALKEMADEMPKAQEQAPLSWFATKLARHGCRPAFPEFVLMAFVGLRAPSPKAACRLVAQAILPFRRMRRAESSERRRHDVGGELSEQARKANAFVLGILKKAIWRAQKRRLVAQLKQDSDNPTDEDESAIVIPWTKAPSETDTVHPASNDNNLTCPAPDEAGTPRDAGCSNHPWPEGRLPRGVGVAQLRELPLDWDRQYETLALDPI